MDNTPTQELLREIPGLLRQRQYREICDRIGKLVREQPAAIGKAQVTLGNLLALGADWAAVRRLLQPDTNCLETSGWLNSMANGKPVDSRGEPIPWFTYPAIDFLTQIIRSDWRVFEWGSGYSTLWWARHVRTVTSVEDNQGWYDVMHPQMPTNASVLWRGEPTAYVGAIGEQTGQFDLVVIDGSSRNECARIVTEHMTDSGVIVFDNSDVAIHQEGVEYLKGRGWHRLDFFGLIPSYYYKNCTSIFYRDPASIEPANWPGGIASCVGPTCDQALCAARRSSA